MRKYNISAYLLCTIEQLYDKTTSAFQTNDSIGELFRGRMSSVTLRLQHFIELIMSDALEEPDERLA